MVRRSHIRNFWLSLPLVLLAGAAGCQCAHWIGWHRVGCPHRQSSYHGSGIRLPGACECYGFHSTTWHSWPVGCEPVTLNEWSVSDADAPLPEEEGVEDGVPTPAEETAPPVEEPAPAATGNAEWGAEEASRSEYLPPAPPRFLPVVSEYPEF